MYILFVFLLLAVDQMIKFMVRSNMSPGESFPVLVDFFHITFVQNRGAAFGMFQNGTLFFVAVTLVVLAGVIYYMVTHKDMPKLWKITIAVVIAGALGNLIDRVFLGYVVDMFDFRGIWKFVFNFADICVVLGGMVLFYLVMTDKKVMEK